jgi:regulatory factor X, other
MQFSIAGAQSDRMETVPDIVDRCKSKPGAESGDINRHVACSGAGWLLSITDNSVPAQNMPQNRPLAMDGMRSRSNTSSSTKASGRPKSRASTTSTQSATTQLHPDQNTPTETFAFNLHHHQQTHPLNHDPEEMIRQSAHQLTNPHQGFVLDPALRDPNHPNLPFPSEQAYSIHNMPPGVHGMPYQAYDGMDHSVHENMTEEQASDGPASKRKKGSATTIANDIELRRLYRENEGKSLEDMAKEVLTHERGAKSEKSKQIFAMLW